MREIFCRRRLGRAKIKRPSIVRGVKISLRKVRILCVLAFLFFGAKALTSIKDKIFKLSFVCLNYSAFYQRNNSIQSLLSEDKKLLHT